MSRKKIPLLAPQFPRDTEIPIGSGTLVLHDESDQTTTVLINGVPSSVLRVEEDYLDFEYMRHIAAGIAAWGGAESMLALHVGAGVGTLPRHLVHSYPRSRHIAVDIDTVLPALARELWELPRAPQLRLRTQDGLAVLTERADASADLIVRDAFYEDQVPPTLRDANWWQHAARAIRANGLIAANIASYPSADWISDEVSYAHQHFANVHLIAEGAVLKRKRRGNVILLAHSGIDEAALKKYAASAPLPTGVTRA